VTTRILFFGNLKDIAGCAERIVELPAGVINTVTLIDWLAADDRSLADALRSDNVRIAIDQEIMKMDVDFRTANEIAFMPPFSGG
jgi:molybdopterin converting factor small subunit